MVELHPQPRASGAEASQSIVGTILDRIRMLRPLNTNGETASSVPNETLLDQYVPFDPPGENPNESCYWDKKIIKEKRELEQSVARMRAKNRSERMEQNQSVIAEQAAKSAARRSGGPDDGIGYYRYFK